MKTLKLLLLIVTVLFVIELFVVPQKPTLLTSKSYGMVFTPVYTKSL